MMRTINSTTFDVSSDVKPEERLEEVDVVSKLRGAFQQRIEAMWRPSNSMVACDDEHALLAAFCRAFYKHLPLRISPDAIWITLARGFALHINEHAEKLRHRFVNHKGQVTLTLSRPDFLPGRDNPWPEVFEGFSEQISERLGPLVSLVQADFSTTGPVERAVSHLMAMETFKTYFKYVLRAGCGIPSVTLTGTATDWCRLREKAQRFADYGLEHWIEALDPVLAQFERAACGQVDTTFWKSIFRYNSGSGPAVLTGWSTVLFPYLEDYERQLRPNPFLKDWKERLAIDDSQNWRQRWDAPQGVGLRAFPVCLTSVPLKVFWGSQETDMRLVGGLIGVTQEPETLTVEPECGWAVVYENSAAPKPARRRL